MSKRIVSAILCLALVVAMAIPAFAATTTLYSRTNAGYRITGTANVSSSYASTTMTASEVSGTPLRSTVPLFPFGATLPMIDFFIPILRPGLLLFL